MLQTTTLKKSFRKTILLFLLTLFGTAAARAELWIPVGEVDWTEGALTGRNSDWNQAWKVAVERSDTRPGVFRLQPYANCPYVFSYQRRDNVYVYLHAENPDKVYMEYYVYYCYKNDYEYHYYHVFQRCPENGFDVQYYGKIVDKNSIEFPANSFAVDWSSYDSKMNAPTSYAKYSTYVHRIVFPDGVLGYVPPQESWVSVGTGHFVDPVCTFKGGKVAETDVTVYKSTTRKDVYKFTPFYFNSDVYLHAEDPDKVYLEIYSVKNEDYTYEFTQQCQENGSALSQYGKLQNGIAEIPSEYFVVRELETSESFTIQEEGRKCVITLPEGCNKPVEEDHGIYMGLISFNDKLQSKPITLLNETSKDEFTNFVDNMEMGNATLLYYAVDQAVTTMAAGTYPDNLSNAVLITFTDGLDQGSLAMAPEHRTSRNYAAYLSERIGSTSVQEHPLQAYAIGLKSNDVADDELFMLNLEALASSPENAHSVSDISEVQEELSRLYEELSRQTSKRTISVSVPMMSHDDTYRFTFDHVSDNVENSGLYVEGTFNIDDFSLENVTYHGFTSSSGTKIVAERDGVYLKFTFDDCRTPDGNILKVEKEDIDQWIYIATRDTWQHNVENDKDGKINIEDIKSSSVIMFALDCSSSLDDLFPTLKETAKSFIDRLAGGNGTNMGIEEIVTDGFHSNAPAKYFNMQGLEVKNPCNGIFIEVKDGKSRKLYIR